MRGGLQARLRRLRHLKVTPNGTARARTSPSPLNPPSSTHNAPPAASFAEQLALLAGKQITSIAFSSNDGRSVALGTSGGELLLLDFPSMAIRWKLGK